MEENEPQEKSAQMTQLIRDHEGLFEKVLACQMVYKSHPDYEDQLQELRVDFYEFLVLNPEADLLSMQGHLFMHLTWGLKDRMRKSVRRKKWVANAQAEADAAQRYPYLPGYDDAIGHLADWEYLNELGKRLSLREAQYLELRLLGLNMKEIARQMEVSRQTVYRMQKRVRKKSLEITGKG